MLRLAFTFLFTGTLSAIFGYSNSAAAINETVKLQAILFLLMLFLSLLVSSTRKNMRFRIIAGGIEPARRK